MTNPILDKYGITLEDESKISDISLKYKPEDPFDRIPEGRLLEPSPKSKVLSSLKSHFSSPSAISGIMANIDIETGGTYDHLQKQGGDGPGRGLFQMEGGMLKAYQKNLKDNSLIDSTNNQILFMKNALDSGDIYDIGAGNRIKIKKALESDNPETATEVFMQRFERPGTPHTERRKESSLKLYKDITSEDFKPKVPKPQSSLFDFIMPSAEASTREQQSSKPGFFQTWGKALKHSLLHPFTPMPEEIHRDMAIASEPESIEREENNFEQWSREGFPMAISDEGAQKVVDLVPKGTKERRQKVKEWFGDMSEKHPFWFKPVYTSDFDDNSTTRGMEFVKTVGFLSMIGIMGAESIANLSTAIQMRGEHAQMSNIISNIPKIENLLRSRGIVLKGNLSPLEKIRRWASMKDQGILRLLKEASRVATPYTKTPKPPRPITASFRPAQTPLPYVVGQMIKYGDTVGKIVEISSKGAMIITAGGTQIPVAIDQLKAIEPPDKAPTQPVEGELSIEPSKDAVSKPQVAKTPITDPLTAEAKKFKTAEEFVGSKGTPVYHGTPSTFEEFDIEKGGSNTTSSSGKKGIFFSSSKKTADSYRVSGFDFNKAGLELNAKIERLLSEGNKREGYRLHDELMNDEFKSNPKYHTRVSSGETKEAIVNLSNPLVKDMDGKSWDEQQLNDIIGFAKREGYDGVILKNSYDATAHTIDKSDITIVFEPKAIKTKQQLTDIWNKAQEGEGDQALLEEAKSRIVKKQGKRRVSPIPSLKDNMGDTLVVEVESFGRKQFVPLLAKYRGHDIVMAGEDVSTWDPVNKTLFRVGLDDSKRTGERFIDEKANNIETAKKYIDWKLDKGGQSPSEQAKKFKTAEEFVEKLPTVFRGTIKDSGKFRAKGIGVHFGTKEQASFVAKAKGGEKGVIKEVFLDIKNPVRLEDRNAWGKNAILQQLKEKGIVSEEEFNHFIYGKGADTFDVREVLKSKGYDGIVYANKAEGKGDSYIAFSNDQIKAKSQLTDIWNKAQEKPETKLEQAKDEGKIDISTEILQSPEKYGINEEQLRLFPKTETEVSHGSEAKSEENTKEVVKDLQRVRGIRPTGPIHPTEVSEIVKEIESRGFIDYRGLEVNGFDDIAELAAAYRHPKIEQFQVFYLKDNKVLAHRVISSGAGNFVYFPSKNAQRVKKVAQNLEADAVYFAHNHPSGNPKPSLQDIGITNYWNKDTNGLVKGHIVTNGRSYYSIETTNGKSEATERIFSEEKADYRRQLPGAANTETVAKEVKKTFNGEKASVVFLDSQNNVLSIDNIGLGKDYKTFIEENIKRHKANKAILSLPTTEPVPTIQFPPETVDVIMINPKTGLSSSVIDSVRVKFPPPGKKITYGVKEKPKPYKREPPVIPPEDIVGFEGHQGEGSNALIQYEKQKDLWIGDKDVRVLQSKIEQRRLQKEILTALDKKKYDDEAKDYDKAIQIYIDTQRNPEHSEKYFSKLTPEQQKIVTLSQNLPDGIKVIADNVVSSYKTLGLEALDSEVIRNVLDNYTARVWDLEGKQGTQKFRKFGTTTRHAKARKFETIIEGWADGYKLKVEGATTNLQILKEEIVKTIEDKKFINSLKKIKTIDGQPLLSSNQLEGYKRVEHPNFKSWKYAGKAPEVDATGKVYGRNFFRDEEGNLFERRDLFAPEKEAKNLNNILGISKLKGIPLVDFATKWNAVVKSWILQSSFFHHLAFMRSYYFGTNHKKWDEIGLRQAYKQGIKAIEDENPLVILGVKNGLTLGLKQDWDEEILKESSAIDKYLDKIKIVKGTKDKVLDLRQKHVNFLFGEFGAGLKAKSFIIEYKNMLKKHPDKSSDEIAKMVANLINDDFGGLHLQRLGRNPTVQHIFRLFGLAPDWTESNIRTMVKSFKAGSKEETKFYRRFWSGIFTKAAIITVLGNALMSGLDEDDSEGKGYFGRMSRNYKRAWKEGKLRWMDIDITALYKILGGKTDNRKYFSVLGHFRDPIKFLTHPIRSLHHKGSILYGMFHEMMTGVDWAGRRFTTGKELFGVDKEKGKYKTTRKGRYKKGDPKWGKLKGKTVTWDFKGKGPLNYTQILSYTLSQMKGATPVQIQNLMGWLAGEMEGFDAFLKSIGLRISTTYDKPDKKKKTRRWSVK